MFCQKCGAAVREDSQFCSRCGHPSSALPTQRAASPQQLADSSPRTVGIVVAAIVMVVAGFVWFTSSWQREPRPHQEPLDKATTTRMQAAIALCDSAARAKLYFPNTMEIVGEPDSWPNDVGGFVVNRDIAAKDRQGLRYRYRYLCIAAADGRGGLGNVSVSLTPTNE